MTDGYRRALHLAEVGRYDDAERSLRAALADAPRDADLLTLLGFVLRMRQDYAAALRACDAAVAADPGVAGAHAERAENLRALIRDRDAVAAATEATRLAPHDPAGYLVLARALCGIRQYDRARAVAREGLALRPRSVDGLLTVADVERDSGHRDAAEAATRSALAIDPANQYGRWLLAMLDAERFRVGRSMRALREVARDNPGRPDVISMTWPVRSLLSGVRRWLPPAVALIVVLLVVANWWTPAAWAGRGLAGLFAAVVAGLAVRVLVPAGRLPWRCLRLVPELLRRAILAGLVTVGVTTALLIGYAASGWWPLPLLALAAVPLLWACGFAELLGIRLDDPGFRYAVRELRAALRHFRSEVQIWWRTTKKELHEVWHEPADKTGHR